MPMLLKSYQNAPLPLEEWTDDMLPSLEGWSGWQFAVWNTDGHDYRWRFCYENNDFVSGTGYSAGDAGIKFGEINTYGRDGVNVGQESAMPRIAGRPYVLWNNYYYVKGDVQASQNGVQSSSIARFSRLPY